MSPALLTSVTRSLKPADAMTVVWTSSGRTRGMVIQRPGESAGSASRVVGMELERDVVAIGYRTTHQDSGRMGSREWIDEPHDPTVAHMED